MCKLHWQILFTMMMEINANCICRHTGPVVLEYLPIRLCIIPVVLSHSVTPCFTTGGQQRHSHDWLFFTFSVRKLSVNPNNITVCKVTTDDPQSLIQTLYQWCHTHCHIVNFYSSFILNDFTFPDKLSPPVYGLSLDIWQVSLSLNMRLT